MYSTQSKNAKMLENMTHKPGEKLVETDSKIIKIMELADKNVKQLLEKCSSI